MNDKNYESDLPTRYKTLNTKKQEPLTKIKRKIQITETLHTPAPQNKT